MAHESSGKTVIKWRKSWVLWGGGVKLGCSPSCWDKGNPHSQILCCLEWPPSHLGNPDLVLWDFLLFAAESTLNVAIFYHFCLPPLFLTWWTHWLFFLALTLSTHLSRHLQWTFLLSIQYPDLPSSTGWYHARIGCMNLVQPQKKLAWEQSWYA